MKKFELDGEQNHLLERSFQAIPSVDGWQEKFEAINEKIMQTARYLMTITKKSPEQTLAVRKLQEAQAWFVEAVKKNEF